MALLHLHRETELVVIRPQGQLGAAPVGSLVCGGHRQQRWPLCAGGQAQLASGEDSERLILPDRGLVSFGMMRIGRSEAVSALAVGFWQGARVVWLCSAYCPPLVARSRSPAHIHCFITRLSPRISPPTPLPSTACR